MFAIPIDTKDSTTLSELYGRVQYFALLDTQTGVFKVIENEVAGEGPKSAEFLSNFGVNATIFYHMGEGVYNSFAKKNIAVYSADHTHYTLDEIYHHFLTQNIKKLDSTNYKNLLDPGEGQT